MTGLYWYPRNGVRITPCDFMTCRLALTHLDSVFLFIVPPNVIAVKIRSLTLLENLYFYPVFCIPAQTLTGLTDFNFLMYFVPQKFSLLLYVEVAVLPPPDPFFVLGNNLGFMLTVYRWSIPVYISYLLPVYLKGWIFKKYTDSWNSTSIIILISPLASSASKSGELKKK